MSEVAVDMEQRGKLEVGEQWSGDRFQQHEVVAVDDEGGVDIAEDLFDLVALPSADPLQVVRAVLRDAFGDHRACRRRVGNYLDRIPASERAFHPDDTGGEEGSPALLERGGGPTVDDDTSRAWGGM